MKQFAVVAMMLYSSTGVQAHTFSPWTPTPLPMSNFHPLGPTLNDLPRSLPLPPDENLTLEVIILESPEHPDVEPPPVPVPVYIKPKPRAISDEGLYRLRMCESTDNYAVNTGNGFVGAYQFIQATWNAAAARLGRYDLVGVPVYLVSPADQDEVTAYWWTVSDPYQQWPVCSRRV